MQTFFSKKETLYNPTITWTPSSFESIYLCITYYRCKTENPLHRDSAALPTPITTKTSTKLYPMKQTPKSEPPNSFT
jgi:hypothetical protein